MSAGDWLLLLCPAGVAVSFGLSALGTPGWWRLPLLFGAACAVCLLVLLAAGAAGLPDPAAAVLALAACVGLAIAVTRCSVAVARGRAAPLGAAVAASVLGAVATPAAIAVCAVLLLPGGPAMTT